MRTRAVLIALALVAAIAAAALYWSTHQEPTVPPGPPITSTPQATPTPEPTTDPSDGGHGDDGDGDQPVDLSSHEALARALVSEYLAFDREEPAEVRRARLAPYVEPGSPVLSQVPGPAAVDMWDRTAFNAVVEIVSIDLVAPSNLDESGEVITITVVATYRATYTQPGQSQVVIDRGEWRVQIPLEKPERAFAVIDP